ncbi:MAG: hypothetical protein KY395_05285, partial [Actinobacteria bacterium]|nr:hypothetical protein [Actinomycetota bacterium]
MGHLLTGQPTDSLDRYLATDIGGLGLEAAQRMGSEAVREEILASGLRGRGGGGFLTGRKWAGVVAQGGTHRYVVANGAEGEPGTFKDRALMRENPYQLVEGVMIAAFAVGASEAFIALKAGFGREAEAVTRAVQEMQAAGLCRDCQVTVVRGPDEYLFGEEKALLEVIEGAAPLPRLFPPHEHGLFATAPQTGWEATAPRAGHTGSHQSNPTAVNNVETLSNVPHILVKGAEWFRSIGPENSPGTLVCTVVGDVRRPSVGEMDMGTPLSEVIDVVGGGVGEGRAVKAVLSGVANPVLPSDRLDTPLDYEAFAEAGSGLGAAGFIVYDDTACMVEVARLFSRFLYVESCGQCPPCKRGSGEITERLAALGTRFSQNVLADESSFRLVLESEHDLAGLAEAVDIVDVVMLRLSLVADAIGKGDVGTAELRYEAVAPILAELDDTPRLARQRLRCSWVEVELAVLEGRPPTTQGLPAWDPEQGVVFPDAYAHGTTF